MKKNKFVSVSFIVLAIGILFIGIGVCLGGRVYGFALGSSGLIVNSNLPAGTGTANYIEENMELEPFESLEINTDSLEVHVQESDFYGIEYCVLGNRKLEMKLVENKLVIEQKKPTDATFIFSFGSINFNPISSDYEYLILYVPKGTQFESIEIKNRLGDISIDQLHAAHFSLNGNFSNVSINNLNTADGYIDMKSGNIKIGMLTGESFKIENNFGDIIVDKMACENIEIDVECGDCQIQNMSGENVSVSTQFSNIELGLCEGVDSYNINATTQLGDIFVNDDEIGTSFKNVLDSINRNLIINCKSGDLSLYDTDNLPVSSK